MTAKSRYWDYERCCWVAYESAVATSTTWRSSQIVTAEQGPVSSASAEQRIDGARPPRRRRCQSASRCPAPP